MDGCVRVMQDAKAERRLAISSLYCPTERRGYSASMTCDDPMDGEVRTTKELKLEKQNFVRAKYI